MKTGLATNDTSARATSAAGNASPILFIIVAAILFSTGGLFIKLTSLSAFQLSCGRSLLAAAVVAVFTRREGFGINRVTAITSVLYAALLLLFVLATKLTTAANAIFLQYTAPIFILLLEPAMYKERLRRTDVLTVVVCVAGMSLFFVGKLRPQDWQGNVCALISGLFFALFTLLLRHPRAREVNRASSVLYGNLLLFVVTAPSLLPILGDVSLRDFGIIAYLGVVQIGIAYTFFTLGLARGVRSLDAGIVGYIEPVLNPVLVLLFYGERPGRWAILGGAIIISAACAHALWGAKRSARPIVT
ncbi:MAG: EamA family transporter [Pyrinomonadaceae bacterium]|nr:EamA family transporter [Pyrinomonadaceae bacterium]